LGHHHRFTRHAFGRPARHQHRQAALARQACAVSQTLQGQPIGRSTAIFFCIQALPAPQNHNRLRPLQCLGLHNGYRFQRRGKQIHTRGRHQPQTQQHPRPGNRFARSGAPAGKEQARDNHQQRQKRRQKKHRQEFFYHEEHIRPHGCFSLLQGNIARRAIIAE
jgi:hypothetical protein